MQLERSRCTAPQAECLRGGEVTNILAVLEEKTYLDDWAASVLADPVSKEPRRLEDFSFIDGVLDARVYLRSSAGFKEWADGQAHYEQWESSSAGYRDSIEAYLREIEYDAEVYSHFDLSAPIIDVGGGSGTVREFLAESAEYLSVDPFIEAPHQIPPSKAAAYRCLSRPLNFVAGMAEFLPVRSETFRTVHMRSMLDHVQVRELAVMEAWRVLEPGGSLLVGLSLGGTPYGGSGAREPLTRRLRTWVGAGLRRIITREKDHHVWRPRLQDLVVLLEENGFDVGEPFWQSEWKGRVVYIMGTKRLKIPRSA